MSTIDSAVETFETNVLLPMLREISQSKRLQRDYEVTVVVSRPAPKPEIEELLELLSTNAAPGKRTGPSLALENRERPAGIPPLAGRYVMTVVYDIQGDQVYASPAVMFWMRFNGRLHAFNHRYDNDIALMQLASITRHHIANHVLSSFDFYKIEAFSSEPFPGYR